LQSAALYHVNVGGCQLAVTKIIDAPAATSTSHSHALLQVWWQLAFCCQIEMMRVLVLEPDPTGAQSQHICDQTQRALQRLAHIGRRIQRLRDGADNSQLAVWLHTSVTTGRIH